MGLSIVILAAGRGKRMQSEQPKVLQPLAGRPLLEHVTATASELGADQIHVIVGFGSDLVKSELSHLNVNWIEQKEQLGTGDAVSKALPFIDDEDQILTLVGDIPLISSQTLRALLSKTPIDGLGLVCEMISIRSLALLKTRMPRQNKNPLMKLTQVSLSPAQKN